MGFILLLIASLLKWILSPLLFIHGTICSLFKKEWNNYDTELAIAKDCYGNVLGQYLFNFALRKPLGHRFGNREETISGVLGKNERTNTLTWLGRRIAGILNAIQKDHCKLSIDDTIK